MSGLKLRIDPRGSRPPAAEQTGRALALRLSFHSGWKSGATLAQFPVKRRGYVLLTLGYAFLSPFAVMPQERGDFNNDGFDDLAIGVPEEDIGAKLNAGAVHVFYGSDRGLQAGDRGRDDQFWHQGSSGVSDTPEGGDSFGRSLEIGDFNNDGFDDLAIGAPLEDIGAKTDAGAVHVLYGSDRGLQAGGRGRDDQFWHQDVSGVEGNVEDVAEGGDDFGWSLTVGDFNADGFDDLAIGVPGENLPKFDPNSNDFVVIESAGAVNVLYGSATGLQASGVGGPNDQFWHQDIPGVLDEVEDHDAFGFSLTAGDFNADSNNDGFDDLAIGVIGEDLGSPTALVDAGAVNVLYGSAAGLQASGLGGPDDQFWHQASGDVLDEAEQGDRFGWSLTSGDFNGDTLDDLAIGVPREDLGLANALEDAGAVNVLFGSAAGLQASGLGGPDDQLWHQHVSGIEDDGIRGDGDSNFFGWALIASDFNGDGLDDLAIGAPFGGHLGGSGMVHVLYGSEAGPQASGIGGPNDQIWHQDSPGVRSGWEGVAEGGDFFGYALAAGDCNGDGYDDLAIGAPGEDFGGRSIHASPRSVRADAGAVNVIYGSPVALQASGIFGPDDQFWHQGLSGVKDSRADHESFGAALSAGAP